MAWLWTGLGIAMYSAGVNIVLIMPGDNRVPEPVCAAAIIGVFPV